MSRAEDFAYLRVAGPIGLAHRGGAAYGPNRGRENTVAAFAAAVDLGYRYLETDVHATRDGAVVAFHDDRLDRVTDATGRISELTWAEVSAARVGGREPIPRLDELLESFPDARFNIDLKSDAVVRGAIRILTRARATGRICVGSFDPARIRLARTLLGPEVATAVGPRGVMGMRLAPAPLTRLLHSQSPVLQVPSQHRVAGRIIPVPTPGLIRRAHALGKHVHVWFDEPGQEGRAEFERLLDLGVDGIVADRIDVLADVLAERGYPLIG